MTIQESQNLLTVSNQVGTLTGYSFGMAFAEAVEKLENEVRRVEKLHKKSKEFEEYEKEEQKLYVKYSQKKKDGVSPKLNIIKDSRGNEIGGHYIFDKSREEEREDALSKLKEKYKKEIDEQKKKEQNYKEALQSESNFKKVKLKKELMPGNPEGKYPDEKVSGNQLFLIRKLIEIV